MNYLSPAVWAKVERALVAIESDAELKAAVMAGVDGFFITRPHLERTRFAEAVTASLILDQLSQAADSQSGAGTDQKTDKVA